MSYESEMELTRYKLNPQTKKYDIIHDSHLNYPPSKNPISVKLWRAIHDRLSFNNLGSTVCTRIRWVGNFYIVSFRTFSLGLGDRGMNWTGRLPMTGCGEVDIAVGRQGEYPFMFRSPSSGIPNKKYANSELSEPERLKESYHWFRTIDMYKRLEQLGCVFSSDRVKIGEFINPNTGRKNKISVSAPFLRIISIDGTTPTAIGDTMEDLAGRIVDPTFDPMDENDPRHESEYIQEYFNKRWDMIRNSMRWVPLLTAGWYFRNSGKLIKETIKPNIEKDDLL